MSAETLALAAHQLIEAGFRQARHEGPGGFGNEYYEFTGLGAVIRLVRDRGEERFEIEDPDGSGWYGPSRWLRTENNQTSLADCVAMTITRRAELRSAIAREATAASDHQEG